MIMTRHVLAVAGVLVALGCGGDNATAPGAERQYWQLTLDQHAITLSTHAPYNTVQLVATPRTVDGVVLPDAGTPTFTAGDTSVIVTADGHVTGHSPASGVPVVVSLTVGGAHGLTLTDTAWVNVNDIPAPQLPAQLRLLTTPGDSAKTDLANTVGVTLVGEVTDSLGNPIPDVLVAFRSADSTIVTVDPRYGGVVARGIGTTRLYTETSVYGVQKVDSLTFTVGNAIFAQVEIDQRQVAGQSGTAYFALGTLTVGQGAIVLWRNQSHLPIDVTFDDPSHVAAVTDTLFGIIPPSGGGDIPVFAAMDSTGGANGVGFRARRFPVPGTYTYRSTLYGSSGKIIVQ